MKKIFFVLMAVFTLININIWSMDHPEYMWEPSYTLGNIRKNTWKLIKQRYKEKNLTKEEILFKVLRALRHLSEADLNDIIYNESVLDKLDTDTLCFLRSTFYLKTINEQWRVLNQYFNEKFIKILKIILKNPPHQSANIMWKLSKVDLADGKIRKLYKIEGWGSGFLCKHLNIPYELYDKPSKLQLSFLEKQNLELD